MITKNNLLLFNQNLRFEAPSEIIEFALDLATKPVISTSFGPRSAALLHAVTTQSPNIQVLWCDTGYNTAATYSHAQHLESSLGLNLKIFSPQYTTAYLDATIGQPELHNPEHSKFSELVKLEPFKRAMDVIKPDVWFTNIRKGQTALRNKLDILSLTEDGVLKVSPFYHFTDAQLDAYLITHKLPVEFDYFDPVKALEHRECGIHLNK